MKFYNRERELAFLNKQFLQTDLFSTMTVITGRRRVGKTVLSLKYVENKRFLYLFIAKKNEVLLCRELVEIIKRDFDIPIIGEIRDFKTLFNLVMEIGKREKIVVIVDEFQEFYNINPSVYSDIQNIWDRNKETVKIHLIFIGSIYSLMTKIFRNSKEPLFNRADKIMNIKPFPPKVIKKILVENNRYSVDNLFVNYLVTGGVPRYEEILVKNQVFTRDEIIDFCFCEDSPFIEEGKIILTEEFGKEYRTYFSILELLSEGRTSRSEIESILEKNIGGYLERLESDYNLISKVKPVGSKTTGRVQKYHINDNFLSFWFRFIYKYRSSIEAGNYEYLKEVFRKQIQNYSGPVLEKLYREILRDSGEFNIIGNYWERRNLNEIDIVAISDSKKKLLIGEVKINKAKINLRNLKEKSKRLVGKYQGYTVEYIGLGMEDIDSHIE